MVTGDSAGVPPDIGTIAATILTIGIDGQPPGASCYPAIGIIISPPASQVIRLQPVWMACSQTIGDATWSDPASRLDLTLGRARSHPPASGKCQYRSQGAGLDDLLPTSADSCLGTDI